MIRHILIIRVPSLGRLNGSKNYIFNSKNDFNKSPLPPTSPPQYLLDLLLKEETTTSTKMCPKQLSQKKADIGSLICKLLIFL